MRTTFDIKSIKKEIIEIKAYFGVCLALLFDLRCTYWQFAAIVFSDSVDTTVPFAGKT